MHYYCIITKKLLNNVNLPLKCSTKTFFLQKYEGNITDWAFEQSFNLKFS